MYVHGIESTQCTEVNILSGKYHACHIIIAIYVMPSYSDSVAAFDSMCFQALFSPIGRFIMQEWLFWLHILELDVVSGCVIVHICAPALPDIEGAFLTGAQGAWSRAHAAVHHLLPQVVDLGLKATILCKETNKETNIINSSPCKMGS